MWATWKCRGTMGTTFGRPHPLLLILFMVPALLDCGRTPQPTIAVVPKAQSHFFWQAVKARRLQGKVKIVGFDTSPSLVEDLRTGVIDSLVLQDPFNMAIQAFQTLMDKLEGGTPPRRVDMAPTLATSQNFRHPKISRLLDPQPNIDRYLK